MKRASNPLVTACMILERLVIRDLSEYMNILIILVLHYWELDDMCKHASSCVA